MNYPLISEYVEAIKSAKDNFKELTNLYPIPDGQGEPVMTSGNFAVVFMMQDIETGKFYALKCFTKEQERRTESYRLIAEELGKVKSPYIVSLRYLEKELFVDSTQTEETEFPVVLMDWVKGITLDKYLRENIDDKFALEMLAYRFSLLAQWLIPQPFAHGDLKPDNILVRDDGTLVLVDYDGMYVPAMKGQKARELGSPDFRHPLRTVNDFDEHIDDFPVISILLSLIGISKKTDFLAQYGAPDRLLFSKTDFSNITQQEIIKDLFLIDDEPLRRLTCLFVSLCDHIIPITIPVLELPVKMGEIEGRLIPGVELLSKFSNHPSTPHFSIDELLEGFKLLNDLMRVNGIDFVLTGSLALYMHGLVPASYVPHDIDIIISSKNKHPLQSNLILLDLFTHFCGETKSEYAYSNAVDMFIFYLKKSMIKINAFIDINSVFAKSDFRIMNVMGCEVKVHNALSILEKKYKMRRLKDYQFNNELQDVLNSFFVPQNTDFEDVYRYMILTDKIRDFFNGITFFVGQTETELFTILFNSEVKKIWLPEQLWGKCIVRVTSWEGVLKENDSIMFGIKEEFSKICRLDSSKVLQGCQKRDFSYMVDFLYYILSEMKIVDYFGEHVNELIRVINEYYNDDVYPFNL